MHIFLLSAGRPCHNRRWVQLFSQRVPVPKSILERFFPMAINPCEHIHHIIIIFSDRQDWHRLVRDNLQSTTIFSCKHADLPNMFSLHPMLSRLHISCHLEPFRCAMKTGIVRRRGGWHWPQHVLLRRILGRPLIAHHMQGKNDGTPWGFNTHGSKILENYVQHGEANKEMEQRWRLEEKKNRMYSNQQTERFYQHVMSLIFAQPLVKIWALGTCRILRIWTPRRSSRRR